MCARYPCSMKKSSESLWSKGGGGALNTFKTSITFKPSPPRYTTIGMEECITQLDCQTIVVKPYWIYRHDMLSPPNGYLAVPLPLSLGRSVNTSWRLVVKQLTHLYTKMYPSTRRYSDPVRRPKLYSCSVRLLSCGAFPLGVLLHARRPRNHLVPHNLLHHPQAHVLKDLIYREREAGERGRLGYAGVTRE